MKETLRRGFAKMRGSAGAFLLMEEPLLRKSYALDACSCERTERQDERQEEKKEEQKEERRRSRIGIRPLPRAGAGALRFGREV